MFSIDGRESWSFHARSDGKPLMRTDGRWLVFARMHTAWLALVSCLAVVGIVHVQGRGREVYRLLAKPWISGCERRKV